MTSPLPIPSRVVRTAVAVSILAAAFAADATSSARSGRVPGTAIVEYRDAGGARQPPVSATAHVTVIPTGARQSQRRTDAPVAPRTAERRAKPGDPNGAR